MNGIKFILTITCMSYLELAEKIGANLVYINNYTTLRRCNNSDN